MMMMMMMIIIMRSKWKIFNVDSWHLFEFAGMIWLLDYDTLYTLFRSTCKLYSGVFKSSTIPWHLLGRNCRFTILHQGGEDQTSH